MPSERCQPALLMSTGDFVLVLETPGARRVDGLCKLEGLAVGIIGRVVHHQDRNGLRQAQGGSLVPARQAGGYPIHGRPPPPPGGLLDVSECPFPNTSLAQKPAGLPPDFRREPRRGDLCRPAIVDYDPASANDLRSSRDPK